MPLLQWHELRFAQTQIAVWGKQIHPKLADIIPQNKTLNQSICYKCRVLYNKQEVAVQFIIYQKKVINKLIVKEANDIDYHLKFADRTALNHLTKNIKADEEILIVKNNLLTDTSFTNIALWNGYEWHTPAQPLLHGAHRSKLIAEGTLIEKDIYKADIAHYQKIRLVNAMNDWADSWEINVDKIEIPLNDV